MRSAVDATAAAGLGPLIVAAVWIVGAVIFIALLAWEIQRGKRGWVIFNGAMAALYLIVAIYFATRW